MDSKLLSLAVVPLIVWIGIFVYLLMIDRKLARLESIREEDDL